MKQNPDRYLLISTGDPAGIGPEISIKAIESLGEISGIKLLPVGNLEILQQAADLAGSPTLCPVDSEQTDRHEILNVPLDNRVIPKGEVTAEAGEHAYQILKTCSTWCLQKKAAGLVTCPINKESLKLAGYGGFGHTELLAQLAGADRVETVFCIENLKIFFLTRHLPLQLAVSQIKKERIFSALMQMDHSLKSLGHRRPRLGVPGLNPHCGDGGLFGTEEIEEIAPAVKKARNQGLDVHGPIGADSIFHLGLQGDFDAVLALYHDQGHIAAKTYGFHQTVTLSLGLPYLRTSVDHGTALDIAWQGKGDPESLIHAIRLAVELLNNAPESSI